MHEQRTTKMHKYQCMKFSCIISGCPAGARNWHISYFAMQKHSKKARMFAHPGLFLSIQLFREHFSASIASTSISARRASAGFTTSIT